VRAENRDGAGGGVRGRSVGGPENGYSPAEIKKFCPAAMCRVCIAIDA